MIRRFFLLALVALLAIQFIRPARNDGSISGAHDITHTVPVPDTVLAILKTSCYDCHSNRTVYPWYTNINPVGFWLKGHIDDGKRSINFSDLSGFTKKKLDHRLGDITEQIVSDEMPLSSYTLIHRYAILDTGQVNLLKTWVTTARSAVAAEK